jgi:thiosulfate/3-mercaptopyruvate sulfurtransferase
VPGHMTGAVNIPWPKAANDDGTFRAVDGCHALYPVRASAPAGA